MKKQLLIVLAAIIAGSFVSGPILAARSKGTAVAASSEATKTLSAGGLIEINSASIDELKSFPGITEAYARKM